MPYFDAKGTQTNALLTTSGSLTYYPAGSIIWGDTQYNPAYWMRYGGMLNPGVIWYWVNEDDCDADRAPGMPFLLVEAWWYRKLFFDFFV